MKQREEVNTDLPSYYDPYLKTEPNFLNEPAIISSGSSASAQYSNGHSNANSKEKEEPMISFINAKTKPEFNISVVMNDDNKKSDLVDRFTDAIIESLLKECV